MSKFICTRCLKEYNNIDRKPLSLPCNDVFCEKCLYELYDKKNHILMCPSHKKEIHIEFNKIPLCNEILLSLQKVPVYDTKDNSLYCIRHNKKKLKFFCENDKKFLCNNCIYYHNGHKYVELNLNRENFSNEIKILKNNFENIKCQYISNKNKINKSVSLIKKHIDEQIFKVNNYFSILINFINEKKNKFILKINNIFKENYKNLEKIQNIFSITDEKYTFINNEFYYINNDLLSKGEYETFYNLKNNFIQEIQNFEKYIKSNILNNRDLFDTTNNNKVPTYIYPKNGIMEKKIYDKEEELFGKFDDISLDINKNIINISPRKKLNNNEKNNSIENTNYNKNEKEKIIVNNNEIENNSISLNNISNNNLDSSLIDRKSNMNNNDSFIDKQLIETGFTFFLINKNDVKNVFKQQDSEQSQNEIINTMNNSNNISNKDNNNDKNFNEKNKYNKNSNKENKNNNSNYSKDNYLNNLNNINKMKNNNIINNNININISKKINLNINNNNQNKINNNYNNQINYQNNNYNQNNNIHNNNNTNTNIQNNNNLNNNNILSNFNLNVSNGKKPYKLLNIMNNNKDINN